MFLKRSIGGHHVLARIALGVAVVCVLALVGLLASLLLHEVFR
jgi:hypothetical protein